MKTSPTPQRKLPNQLQSTAENKAAQLPHSPTQGSSSARRSDREQVEYHKLKSQYKAIWARVLQGTDYDPNKNTEQA